MKNIYKNQIEQHLTNRMTVEEFIQLVNGSAKFDTKLLDKLIKEDDANYKKNQPIASMQFKKRRSFDNIQRLIANISKNSNIKDMGIAAALEYLRKMDFLNELTNEIWRTLFLPSLETYITDCLNQSKVNIKGYELNLNSKFISKNNSILKLTEKEIEIILYLSKSQTKHDVLDLQKNIWNYSLEMETHTVETHIYRLRKKINNKFNDENFILSHKNGYFIE